MDFNKILLDSMLLINTINNYIYNGTESFYYEDDLIEPKNRLIYCVEQYFTAISNDPKGIITILSNEITKTRDLLHNKMGLYVDEESTDINEMIVRLINVSIDSMDIIPLTADDDYYSELLNIIINSDHLDSKISALYRLLKSLNFFEYEVNREKE